MGRTSYDQRIECPLEFHRERHCLGYSEIQIKLYIVDGFVPVILQIHTHTHSESKIIRLYRSIEVALQHLGGELFLVICETFQMRGR